MPATPPHVLVIRRRYLGDLVLLGGFLRQLRHHWPAARSAVLAEPKHAGVLALNPDVDDVIASDDGMWPLVRRLRAARFTHVFDFENTPRTALLARGTGAARRVGLHHGGFLLRQRWCYTHRVHDAGAEHESRSFAGYFLQALRALDLPIAPPEIRLVPRPADLAFAHQLLARLTAAVPTAVPRLLVHPGSRSAFRIWPPERFAAVIDQLAADGSAAPVLVGGPAEQALLTTIRHHARRQPAVVDEPLEIGRFAALAATCGTLLCHDSGPMHVAAAVGARVVALFGSQNPALWRPHGDGHIVLQPPLPCSACVAPDRCLPGDSYRNHCVRNLAPDRVLAALRTQLGGEASCE